MYSRGFNWQWRHLIYFTYLQESKSLLGARIWPTPEQSTLLQYAPTRLRKSIACSPAQSTLLINGISGALSITGSFQWCDEVLSWITATYAVRRLAVTERETSLESSEKDIWFDRVSCSQKILSNVSIIIFQGTSWNWFLERGITQFGRSWTKFSTSEIVKGKHQR